jgi:Bax protein
MNFIFRIVLVMLLVILCSCSSTGMRNAGSNLSSEEKRLIAYFKDRLLVSEATLSLKTQEVKVADKSDILRINQTIIQPVVYSRLLSTEEMNADERKSLFIAQMLPHILIIKYYVQQERKIVTQVIADAEKHVGHSQVYSQFLGKLLKQHNSIDTNDLLEKLSSTPTSILLAKAAVMSNWGKSVAYAQASNPFNNPTQTKPGPRLHTFGEGDELIFLKDYPYPPEAVLDFLQRINSQDCYSNFRKMRKVTKDPLVLVTYLDNDSCRQEEKSGKLLSDTIVKNKLTRFDTYSIDPQYINELSKESIAQLIGKKSSQKKSTFSRKDSCYEDIGVVSLTPKHIRPYAEHEIVAINGKYVVPYVYTQVVDLKHLPAQEKKQKFFDMLLPSILVAAHEIKEARVKLQEISRSMEKGEQPSPHDQNFLNNLFQEWEAEDISELLNEKMVIHPSSIMLAQAALETGWGSSRFFTRANNTFGIWSFDAEEPRMRARETRKGKAVYVKKYNNLHESIIDYYKLIAKGPYEKYRLASAAAENKPYEMVKHLNRYSELGEEYVKRLRLVMKQSQLEKYDNYKIDPAFML